VLLGNKHGIILNTVPKSGSHLIEQLVSGIPGVKRVFHTEWHEILPGEFVLNHFHYTKDRHIILTNMGIKQIFVYRDFRDTVVSLAYFIINTLHAHPLYHFYNQHLNRRFEDLITYLIEGVQHPQCHYPSIYEELKPYFHWWDIPGILTLRYEDLVRDQESRMQSCRKMLDYLYGQSMLEMDKQDVIQLMLNNVNPEKSPTFRKGSIGDWKTELNDRHKAVLKKQVGHLLIKWGYEQDLNW
jgi:hypothetical protein